MIFFPSKVSAWAWEGHEIVAYIAEENLTLDAASHIKQLLASEGKSSLTEISSWADYIRPLTNPPQPMHSVRIPLDHTPYDNSLVCKENRCVVGAIEDDISLLKKKDAPEEARMLALKYLVHFVGDVHQPLHASVDTGGEVAASYRGNVLSLHYIWDKTCIAEQSLKPIVIAESIGDLAANVNTAEPAVWAIESRDAARDEIFSSGFSRGSSQPWVLADSYCADHWPLIASRLSSAGHRLAAVLNQLFAK